MSTEIALQQALRARLIATAAVTDLVPATSILDRHTRPAPDPSVILGEDQVGEGDDIKRSMLRIWSTVHVWKKEPSLEGAKAIGGAIRKAVQSARLDLGTGYHCGDCYVSSARYLRDPDGETSHGVLTIESLVEVIS